MAKRLPYAEQLKHPLWKAKRIEVIRRFDWKCYMCGKKNEHGKRKILVVHHNGYIDGLLAWEHPDEMLFCVCNSCHYKIHRFEILKKKETNRIMIGFIMERMVKAGTMECLLDD